MYHCPAGWCGLSSTVTPAGPTSSGHFEGDQQDDDGVKAMSRKEHLKPVGVGGDRVLSVDIWRPVVGCLGNTDF